MIRKGFITIAALAAFYSQAALADARVSVAHFAPFASDIDATSVSVFLNGQEALPNVKFQDFTDYISLPAGEYVVDIIPTGTNTIAMTATYQLEDGVDYTVFASGNGSLQPLQLFALVDDNSAPASGNVKVRVVHAAPFGPTLESTEVSIRTAGGDLVAGLQGVPFGGASGYLELPAGSYDLKVASNNGQTNFIDPLPADLPDGAIATLFAVGDIVNQDLGIIAVPLGNLPLRAVVDDSTNGSYFLDGFDGQGFWMTPIPAQNRLVGSWYTYDAEGNPLWFTFDSCNWQVAGECPTPGAFDGQDAVTTLYQSSGPTEGGAMQMTVPVGTIEFNVVECSLVKTTVTIGDSQAFFDGIRLTPSASCPPSF